MDFRFFFLVYGHHKIENFPVNKSGYRCWNGGQYTSIEAHFAYGPFDPCASVEVPDFSDPSPQGMNFIDFTKLCLNRRKKTREKEPNK